MDAEWISKRTIFPGLRQVDVPPSGRGSPDGSSAPATPGTGSVTRRKLYLHIGTGKAGSTTIQHMLGNRKETDFGYSQVEAFGLGNAWKLAVASGTDIARHYWVNQRRLLTDEEFEVDLWGDAHSEISQSPCERFVVSSEYIFTQYGVSRPAIARLKSELDGLFDEITLVIYLREQVSFLKSHYAQTIKGPMRSTDSFRSFIGGIESIRPMWDYRATLGVWAEVFGRDAMRVVMFDERNFRGGDLLTDFLHRIDVSDEAAAARHAVTERLRSNRSPSYAQLLLLRRLNAAPRGLSEGALRRLILSRRLRFDGISFPGQFANDVLARVAEGNAWVNETYLQGQHVQLPVSSGGLKAGQ